MRKIVLALLALFLLNSCKKEKNTIDVSKIKVVTKVERFEQEFYTASKERLLELKEEFPMFFPQAADSVWINKIENKEEQELFAETQKIYADFSEVKAELISLFKHVKYYNPNFIAPTIFTTLSNIDYANRILYTGQYLVVSLDVYLGEKHEFYNDYPKYVKVNNTKNHIIVDVATAILEKQMQPKAERTFLYKMISEGKKMYALDSYLPTVSDKEKIGYTIPKYNWIKANEAEVWRYFIEKELLYSTNSNLNKRFLDIAPFSKFYLEGDRKTPGRVGVYIGWEIVRSFMKNNDVSLQQLMLIPAEEIFKKSKYKPKK